MSKNSLFTFFNDTGLILEFVKQCFVSPVPKSFPVSLFVISYFIFNFIPSNSDISNDKNTVKKHPGGRPRKEGLKNIQVCLTTPPELYEKVRILSEKYTSGNFSRFLMDECLKSFCRENNISLEDISVPDGVMDMYQNRQCKKK